MRFDTRRDASSSDQPTRLPQCTVVHCTYISKISIKMDLMQANTAYKEVADHWKKTNQGFLETADRFGLKECKSK